MIFIYKESKSKKKTIFFGGGGDEGEGSCGARVSDFFYNESKSKKTILGGRVVGVGGRGQSK